MMIGSRGAIGLLLVGVAACGGGSNGDAPNVDSASVPSMITVSGIASSIGISGRTPEAGALISVFTASDDTMLGSATSDAAGAYSITVASSGAAIDGYLKATKATFKETYLYPPAPLSADLPGATVLLLTPSNWNLVNGVLLGETQAAGNAWIALLVLDNITVQTPIAGATISTTPAGAPHYNNANGSGLPQRQATMTATDGIAYAVNVPAGQVSVTAAKAGATYKSHSIKARADQLTLTIVTE